MFKKLLVCHCISVDKLWLRVAIEAKRLLDAVHEELKLRVRFHHNEIAGPNLAQLICERQKPRENLLTINSGKVLGDLVRKMSMVCEDCTEASTLPCDYSPMQKYQHLTLPYVV